MALFLVPWLVLKSMALIKLSISETLNVSGSFLPILGDSKRVLGFSTISDKIYIQICMAANSCFF